MANLKAVPSPCDGVELSRCHCYKVVEFEDTQVFVPALYKGSKEACESFIKEIEMGMHSFKVTVQVTFEDIRARDFKDASEAAQELVDSHNLLEGKDSVSVTKIVKIV